MSFRTAEVVFFATDDKFHIVDWRKETVLNAPLPAVWTEKNIGRQQVQGAIFVFGNNEEPSDVTIVDASTAVVDRLSGRFATTQSQWCLSRRIISAADSTRRERAAGDRPLGRDARKTIGTLPIRGMPAAISPDAGASSSSRSATTATLRLFDLADRSRRSNTDRGPRHLQGTSNPCLFSPDGKFFMAPTSDDHGMASLWNVEVPGSGGRGTCCSAAAT